MRQALPEASLTRSPAIQAVPHEVALHFILMAIALAGLKPRRFRLPSWLFGPRWRHRPGWQRWLPGRVWLAYWHWQLICSDRRGCGSPGSLSWRAYGFVNRQPRAHVGGASFRFLGSSALSIARLAAPDAASLLSDVPDFVPASVLRLDAPGPAAIIPTAAARWAAGRPIEQNRSQRVIGNAAAQVTIDRTHERAARRARLDKADSIATDDANHRRQTKDGITEKTINEDGSGSRRESKNYAARFPAQAAASPEGLSSYV